MIHACFLHLGRGGFLVGEVKRVLPSTGQASKL